MAERFPRRERRKGQIELPLPAEDAFKLFTAEGERLWVPGWSPEMLGAVPQAQGLVFLTGEGDEWTIWTVIASDPVGGILRYSRVTPALRAGLVEVRLTGEGERTRVEVRYDLTALSSDGEASLEAYSAPRFAEMLDTWHALITDFLRSDGARERLAAAIV
jgi:hypothetical protein